LATKFVVLVRSVEGDFGIVEKIYMII